MSDKDNVFVKYQKKFNLNISMCCFGKNLNRLGNNSSKVNNTDNFLNEKKPLKKNINTYQLNHTLAKYFEILIAHTLYLRH